MKKIIKLLIILFSLILIYEVVHLVFIRDMNGWAVLSWIEDVPENGPSTNARPEDVGTFEVVQSFKGEETSGVFDFIALLLLASVVISSQMLWVRKKKKSFPFCTTWNLVFIQI